MTLKPTLILQLLFGISLSYIFAFSFAENSFAQDIFDQATSTSSSTSGSAPETPAPASTSTSGSAPEAPAPASTSTSGSAPESPAPVSTSTSGSAPEAPAPASTSTSGSAPESPIPASTSTSGSAPETTTSSSTSGAVEQQQNIIKSTIITGSCNGKSDCSSCSKETLSPRIGSPFSLCCLSSKHQNLNANGCP